MKKKLFLLITLSVIASVLVACSNTEKTSDKSSNTTKKNDSLTLAIGGEPEEGFDPTTGWGHYGSPLFQSTLVTFDKDFKVQNDLATSYNVSDNGKLWTIRIRDDVKFSDGEPLTAKDVAFTFETAKNSGSVVDLTNLEKVEEIDKSTITFTLREPNSTFLYSLATMGIVPEHAYDDSYRTHPIGSGPFELVQWNKGQQLIVQANPLYYGDKPYFKKLTFLFLSEDAAFAAAKSGQADIVSVTPSFAKQEVPNMSLVQLDSVDNRGIVLPYVPSGEKTADGDPIGNDVTADKAIRKALNIAINRQDLVDGVVEGFGTKAFTVADHLPWWNSETVIEDGNLEEAKKLLDAAGWKENKDGIRVKDGMEAALTLYYPADDQIRQSLSLAFSDAMKPLGIDITTKGENWNELVHVMYSNPVMMGWGSNSPLEMYNIYSSTTKGQDFYNTNYYSNPKVDEYMEKAMNSQDPNEANEYWKKAQWDGSTGFSAKGDTPWVWLLNMKHLYFVRDDLEIGPQKIQPHGHGWPMTDYISQWHWKK